MPDSNPDPPKRHSYLLKLSTGDEGQLRIELRPFDQTQTQYFSSFADLAHSLEHSFAHCSPEAL